MAAELARLESLQLQLNKNLTQMNAAISGKRAANECKNLLPGADVLGAFINPRSMNRGRSAIEHRCQDEGQCPSGKYKDVSTVDEWKRTKRRVGISIGLAFKVMTWTAFEVDDPLAFEVMTWTADDYERWMQSVRKSPKLINYRVRSEAELTNVPELKRAIRDAISEIYGDAALRPMMLRCSSS
jgi:hypothetical protein